MDGQHQNWNAMRKSGGCGKQSKKCDFSEARKAYARSPSEIEGREAKLELYAIADIARRGPKIGCPSYRQQLAYQTFPAQLERNLMIGRDQIEAATGICPNSYRPRIFSITAQSAWANGSEDCGSRRAT